MLYYHVSIGRDEEVKKFTPRIPNNGCGWEDRTIPRICFAPTIELCLSAIQNAEDKMTWCWENNDCIELTVYVLDTDNVVCDILENEEVQTYVPDAFLTGEVWCLDEVVLEATCYVVETYETDYIYIAGESYRKNLETELHEMIQDGMVSQDTLEVLKTTTVHDFINYRIYDEFYGSGLVSSDFKVANQSGTLDIFSIEYGDVY